MTLLHSLSLPLQCCHRVLDLFVIAEIVSLMLLLLLLLFCQVFMFFQEQELDLENVASSTPVELPGTLFHQTFTTLLIRVHSENDSRVYFLIVLITDYSRCSWTCFIAAPYKSRIDLIWFDSLSFLWQNQRTSSPVSTGMGDKVTICGFKLRFHHRGIQSTTQVHSPRPSL